MIEPGIARGWELVKTFRGEGTVSPAIADEISRDSEVAGESSHGTRNVLHAFITALRPKTVLEIGAHIGSAAIVIGTALRANGYGRCFSLEPQQHYFDLLCKYIRKAEIEQYVSPLKMFSTDQALLSAIGDQPDIVFIDADHSYSNAKRDIEIAWSLLPANGLVFLDDVGLTHSPSICQEHRGGVRQALIDFAAGRKDCNVIFLEHPFWLNPCGLAMACKQRVLTT